MVYRGKPSAGCNACRKAKKACGLQQPACSRCVSLKKECSGYRDTSQLQIEDESAAVIRKATRPKLKANSRALLAPAPTIVQFGLATPSTIHREDSGWSSESADLSDHAPGKEVSWPKTHDDISTILTARGVDCRFLMDVKPKADDVSTNYFFVQFTSQGHWKFLQESSVQSDPCISYAIKACGMAALENVSKMTMGNAYTRSKYVEALRLLNAALRDPARSRTDNSLVAVAMLGFFENLTCDSRASIQSWRAHIKGATQLLKIRGKAQFQTDIGREMWLEIRYYVLGLSIWADEEPPTFLSEWEGDLQAAMATTHPRSFVEHPAMYLTEYGHLRSRMRLKTISDEAAAKIAAALETRIVQWIVNSRGIPMWYCGRIKVPDSPHVWNNTVTAYHSFAAVSDWQSLFCTRIMNTHTRALLSQRLNVSEDERQEQEHEFRRVRRQAADDICSSIPVALGHAAPAFNAPCTVVSAYAAIWPLFFAGISALERVSTTSWEDGRRTPSAAVVQVAWIIGRMDYISEVIGLKWSAGIAAVVKGEFRLRLGRVGNDVNNPAWLQEIQDSHHGPRMLLEKEPPPDDTSDTKDSGPDGVARQSVESPKWAMGG